MNRLRLPVSVATVVVAGLVLASAGVARADVKAGVEAWSAGDFARAVAEWKGPSAKGDPDAMFNLAQAYRMGRGVPEDIKQAEALYARAAAKGHIKAADNYGLLLFQDGRREQAMPYVTAASERGDPRAQYLLGIAHFNGDLVAKDWVRAYALLTLANSAGLPQAAQGIRQMDEYIPLPQRQQAQSLAVSMRQVADSKRATALAATDLGQGPAAEAAPPPQVAAALPPARLPQPIASVAVSPSIAAAEAAVAEAMRATGTESPASAGADFARPANRVLSPAASRPARDTAQVSTLATMPEPRSSAGTASSGPWKLQLGAFSVAGNADRLWGQLAGRPALAGKSKLVVPAGNLRKLLATGWPTEGAAQGACNTLRASGQGCIVTR